MFQDTFVIFSSPLQTITFLVKTHFFFFNFTENTLKQIPGMLQDIILTRLSYNLTTTFYTEIFLM